MKNKHDEEYYNLLIVIYFFIGIAIGVLISIIITYAIKGVVCIA